MVRICDKSGRSPQSERGARRLPLAIAFYVPALSGLPRFIAQTLRAPLVRAYGGTAAACLRAAKRVEIVPVQEATIFVPFSDLALVKARLSGASGVQIRNENFTEAGVTITADLPEAAAPHIVRMITDITSGRVSISIKP